MARSRTPRPTQTDSGPGHSRKQDPRSSLEWQTPKARDQFDRPPIEAHRQLEHDDESLMEAWNLVRSSVNGNDGADRQSSSFKPIGNCKRNVNSQMAPFPSAYRTATAPQHRIYVRYFHIFTLPDDERALINLISAENPIQSPYVISPVSRC